MLSTNLENTIRQVSKNIGQKKGSIELTTAPPLRLSSSYRSNQYFSTSTPYGAASVQSQDGRKAVYLTSVCTTSTCQQPPGASAHAATNSVQNPQVTSGVRMSHPKSAIPNPIPPYDYCMRLNLPPLAHFLPNSFSTSLFVN